MIVLSKKTKRAALLTALIAMVGIAIFYSAIPKATPTMLSQNDREEEALTDEVVSYMYDLPLDSFDVALHNIASGESFGKLLNDVGIGFGAIQEMVMAADSLFDVRKIQAGKPSYFFRATPVSDSALPAYWVYEINPLEYIVFQLAPPYSVRKGKRALTIRERTIAGTIESSLYLTLQELAASPNLAVSLADIYAWTVDFFRIQKGDGFRVIFEEKYVDDSVFVGIGAIKAASFYHGGRQLYAFDYIDTTGNSEFYDEEGKSLRKAFLKAPLKFFRISSKYNPKRLHPVLKTMRPHLGTDYAAPTGTPIMTTADGTVEKVGYTSGNGNYVKVKHNSVYSTQYLHMSRIAQGMKVGKRLRQGDVIGFVGSTGLATGPHVCYRFWKNGRQVNPLKEQLPESHPIPDAYRADFENFIAPLKVKLDSIKLPGEPHNANAHPLATL